jgi:predicted nucleic acid-binding protein
MSLVVSDTTPLNYLILIGAVEVLPKLFRKILIPPAVITEMRHPKAPASVATWAAHPPDWIEIRSARHSLWLELGAGESEAISLVSELTGAALLVDDKKARFTAEQRGILAFGTINILDLADEMGLLDFEQAVTQLSATTFHLERSVLNEALRRIRARRSGGT